MISIIACSFGHMPNKLPVFLYSMLDQSLTDWELLIYHDGEDTESYTKTAEFLKQFHEDRRIRLLSSPTRIHGRDGVPDWGHTYRARGIEEAAGDRLVFANCDNYLVPVFLEYLNTKMEKDNLDFVYADTLHNYSNILFGGEPYTVLVTRPQLNYIDMNSFMVKTAAAKDVGFTDRSRGADGIFVEKIIAAGYSHGKVNSCLIVHN